MTARKRKPTRGGKRPGAGRPVGTTRPSGLEPWTGRLERKKLSDLAETLGISESALVRHAVDVLEWWTMHRLGIAFGVAHNVPYPERPGRLSAEENEGTLKWLRSRTK